MRAAVPAVEVADDVDAAGVGRPHREVHAAHAVVLDDVSAQLVERLEVGSLTKEVQVVASQHMTIIDGRCHGGTETRSLSYSAQCLRAPWPVCLLIACLALMNRRRFFSTLLAAGAAAPALAQQPSSAPQRIDRLRLDAAESLFGVDFNEAEEQMALGSVNRNLDSYEQLRKLNIPLDTEPAITFRPYLPGKKPTGKSTPGAKLKFARPVVPANLKPEEIAFLPVTALATLIETKRITSTELTKIYLDRLKKYGDTLKCVVTLTEELALKQAADADAEIKAGKYRGPLHGIPWGAKDLLATKGIKTTWGAAPYKDQVIDLDATVVERLRDAGAVLVAKLSMGALAQGGVWFGGSTRNPWNTERSSSGSSAGPGAATAAGLVGFSIGTETLGSIISPSVTNGVTGLRPTYGRVSRYGAMALSWTMDKIGPMCRSVEDCVLVLNAIYGSDGRDDTCTDAPFEWNPRSTARLAQDRLHPEGVRRRRRTIPTRPTRSARHRARATRCMRRRSRRSGRPERGSSRWRCPISPTAPSVSC